MSTSGLGVRLCRPIAVGRGAFKISVMQDYVLVYAESTLAEQTTPAYVDIVDSDMPVTDVVWVGEAGFSGTS